MTEHTASRALPLAVLLGALAIGSAAPLAADQNWLPNGGFDFDTSPWLSFYYGPQLNWNPIGSSPGSGALALISAGDGVPGGNGFVSACVRDLPPGAQLSFGGKARFTAADGTGQLSVAVAFSSDTNCQRGALGAQGLPIGRFEGYKAFLMSGLTIPPTAHSANLEIALTGDAGFAAQFDDLFVHTQLPAPGNTWLRSASIPGFEFQALILAGGTSLPARLEADCFAETACLSGALPGRTELLLRVVGPKPNGFLWPNVVKFSTSRIQVWLRQLSSGTVQFYQLEATGSSARLDGLSDARGFK